jgi:glycosyltransferase involved in cell wall biosynthesis
MDGTPLRILQVITRPQRRGAEIFALDLCGELERGGHATRIVSLYANQEGARLPLREGDLALGGRGASRLEKLPGFQPSLLRRLLTAIDDFRPDVVQVNGSRTVKYGSLARRRRWRAGWALVYRSIGTPSDWVGHRLRRWLYRRLVASRFDAVVAVSANTLDSLQRCYRLAVPARVLPRAVPPPPTDAAARRGELRRRLGTGDDADVLLFVGRLSAEKRPDRLLRVAARVAQQRRAAGLAPPELWIAGTGPLQAEVETTAGTAPHPVRLLGERDDVRLWMAAADLLLLTSDTEGMPGVVVEAGSVGLPAVATRVGGVAECVLHGVTGRLVEADDEASMAQAIHEMLADEERRREMGAEARRLVEERFSLPAVAAGYVAHYRQTLERRRGGRR